MASLGALIYSIKASNRDFKRGMDENKKKIQDLDQRAEESRRTMRRWGAAITAASTAIIAAFTRITNEAGRTAEQLDQMSTQTGIATDRLAALGYAAEQEHASLEQLGTGLTRLARNMRTARDGTGEAAGAFDELGIRVEDVDGSLRATEDVLLEVAGSFENMEDHADRTAMAMQLFGRSGRDLVPFLAMGREGIEELTEEADRLGITMGEEQVAAFREYRDTMHAVREGLRGLTQTIAADVLPMFLAFSRRLQDIVEWFNALPEPLRRTVSQVTLLAAGLGMIVGPMALIVGYLPQIKAGLLAMQAGFKPFLIGGAIVVGVMWLVELFRQLRGEVRMAREEIDELVDLQEARDELDRTRQRIESLQQQIEHRLDPDKGLVGLLSEEEIREREQQLEEELEREEALERRITEIKEEEERRRADQAIMERTREYRAKVRLGEMEAEDFEAFLEAQIDSDRLSTETRAMLSQELSALRIEMEREVVEEVERTLEDIVSEERSAYRARLELARLERGERSFQYQELAREYAEWMAEMVQEDELSHGLRAEMLREYLEDYGDEMEAFYERLGEERARFEEQWSRRLIQETETRLEALDREEKEALAMAEKLGADKEKIEEYFSLQRQRIREREAEEEQRILEDTVRRRTELEERYGEAFFRATATRLEQLDREKAQAIQQAEDIGAETEAIRRYYNLKTNEELERLQQEEERLRYESLNKEIEKARQRAEEQLRDRTAFEEQWSQRLFQQTATRLELLEQEKEQALAIAESLEADKTEVLEYFAHERARIERDMVREQVADIVREQGRLADSERQRIEQTIRALQQLKEQWEDNKLVIKLIRAEIEQLELDMPSPEPDPETDGILEQGLEQLTGALGQAGDLIMNIVSGNWLQSILMLITSTEAFQAISEVLNEVFQSLAHVLEPFVHIIGTIITPVLRVFSTILTFVANTIIRVWNAVLDLISTIPFIDLSAYKMDLIGEADDPDIDARAPTPDRRRAGAVITAVPGAVREELRDLLRPVAALADIPRIADKMLAKLDILPERIGEAVARHLTGIGNIDVAAAGGGNGDTIIHMHIDRISETYTMEHALEDIERWFGSALKIKRRGRGQG